HPAVRQVIPYDKKGRDRGPGGLLRLARALRAERYEWAYLPHRSLRTALVAWLARVPRRAGLDAGAPSLDTEGLAPPTAGDAVEGGERVRQPYAAPVRRGHPASGGAGDERQRAAALRPGRRHSDRGDLWIDGAGVRIRATRSARPGGRARGAAVSPVFRARAAALPPAAPSLHEVAHGG